jgi:hypothetical protein
MTQSARLGLSFIEPGQIDKSVTHNEALALLDVAVCAAVDGVLVNSPPATPAIGLCFIVGTAPTGEWAGHEQALAGFTAGGWRYVEAMDGLTAVIKATGETATFRAGAWEVGNVRASKVSIGGKQVLGVQGLAVANPTGGATVDAEARNAIAEILARLRAHGMIAS